MKKPFALIASVLFLATSYSTAFAAYGVQTKTTGCVANTALPDPQCTPGAVLTTNITTICKVGYTKTVRDVPLSEAKKVFAEYGIPYSAHSNYEVDHLISLELGGSNDISNLWPEPHAIINGSFVKDKIENQLHAQVCSGKMTIQDAQSIIATNWMATTTAKSQGSVPKTTVVQTIATSTAPTTIAQPILVAGPEVKKSTTGICHAKGTAYYNATIHFTAFDSIASCLASGGRLPK